METETKKKRRANTGMDCMIDEDFIKEARSRNALSIKNTYGGEWLDESLKRLEYLNSIGHTTIRMHSKNTEPTQSDILDCINELMNLADRLRDILTEKDIMPFYAEKDYWKKIDETKNIVKRIKGE